MLAAGWLLSYSLGLVALAASLYLWRRGRDRADGLFCLFLGFFLISTLAGSFDLILASPWPPSTLLAAQNLAACGIGAALPLYAGARTGTRWLPLLAIAAAAAAAAYAAAAVPALARGDEGLARALDAALRVLVSAIIVASMIPFLAKGPKSAESLPPKLYRLAGVISMIFAGAIVLPILFEALGLDLDLDRRIIYLAFYAILNIRFLALMGPRLRPSSPAREAARDANFEAFGITPREREIYDLLAKGYSYKEIARLIGVSLPTVKTHVDHLYKKTGTGNKVELINEIDG